MNYAVVGTTAEESTKFHGLKTKLNLFNANATDKTNLKTSTILSVAPDLGSQLFDQFVGWHGDKYAAFALLDDTARQACALVKEPISVIGFVDDTKLDHAPTTLITIQFFG